MREKELPFFLFRHGVQPATFPKGEGYGAYRFKTAGTKTFPTGAKADTPERLSPLSGPPEGRKEMQRLPVLGTVYGA